MPYFIQLTDAYSNTPLFIAKEAICAIGFVKEEVTINLISGYSSYVKETPDQILSLINPPTYHVAGD